MIFRPKTNTALEVILHLITNESMVMSCVEIAHDLQISHGNAEQCLLTLKHALLVKSKRGPGGGYYLDKDAVHVVKKTYLRALDELFYVPTRLEQITFQSVMSGTIRYLTIGGVFWDEQ